jgi:leader peptidase (prepilin peptidase) / N-methyltransferase
MDPIAIALAVAGAAWGVISDRISTRWPAHEEPFVAGRRPGWRTVVCGVVGAVGLGLLPARFTDPLALVAFSAFVVALVLLLATDLDQRVLPDVITIPMIPIVFLYALSGQNPLVGGGLVPAIIAAVIIPTALYVPSLLFGAGAFGLGDVKLLVSVGLVAGAYRALVGVAFGVLVAGIVIVGLLAARRVTLRSYVPFGPFLVLGALWSVLVRLG